MLKVNTTFLEGERIRRGMTKADFSRFLGFKDRAYGKIIESESTTLKRIARMSDLLKVKPYKLLSVQ